MGYTKFYWNSIPYKADQGQGDGTAYATFTGATIDASAKTMTLAGLSILTDAGADGDNKFNSYILKVTSSGNVYHITDWTAATDVATVAETPDSADTGAGEILLNVLDSAQTAANPIRNATDWRPFTLWKGTAATASDIYFFMPNLIKDGGFEERAAGAIGGDWTAENGSWTVAAAAGSCLGSRMASWDTVADSELYADLTATLYSDRTYTVCFKAETTVGNLGAGGLEVKIRQKDSPNNLVDAGFGTAGTWKPTITTTAAWFTQDITPDFDTDTAQLYFDALLANKGTATALYVDEVYLWEKVTANNMIISDHNLNGSENMLARAAYCNPERTNYGATDYTAIQASFDQDGTETINKALTASARPVYHLQVPAEAGKTHEAGIIFIGDLLTFNKSLSVGSTPVGKQKTQMAQNVSRTGQFIAANVEYVEGRAKLTFESVQRTWLEDNYLFFWEQHGQNLTPFFVAWDDANYSADLFLMRSDGSMDYDLGTGPSDIQDFGVSLRRVV
jgi:hypothetical protein